MLGVPQQRICMISENLVFPIWHLVPNPSVLSVEMPFCLTFKGQFLPGIELLSATKSVGPILDLHQVCLRCSTWKPSQGQVLDLGMAWVFLGRKTGFAGTKRDMENSYPSCNLSQRTLLGTLYKHRPKRTLYRHGSYRLVWEAGDMTQIWITFCLGLAATKYSSHLHRIQKSHQSETTEIHLCDHIFRMYSCLMQKETEKYASALDSLLIK